MFLATKVPSLTAGASQYTLYSRVNGGAIVRIKFFSHFGTAAGMSEALENWSGRQKCTLTIPINDALDKRPSPKKSCQKSQFMCSYVITLGLKNNF